MKDRVFQLCDVVREAGYAIHRYHGPGHLEKVCENALVHRLRKQGLDVKQQHPLTVRDEDGTVIGEYYADLVVENSLVVELKAARATTDEHTAQILGYLRASGNEHGLLVNFGTSKFYIKKFAMSDPATHSSTRFPNVSNLFISLLFLFASLCVLCGNAFSAEALRLNAGDHIAILGNALPDRMQFSGYLETLITTKHPSHDLVFRNLAAAGDEIATWQRSENFGTRDQWLSRVRANVIFAFYGFNESFKGYDGLEKFKADLDKFLKETAAKNYSGTAPPRLVLFGPHADEKHQDPNFSDPGAKNENLRDYSEAMAEVAAANRVPFVDLYKPSQAVFATAARKKASLTVNGHYLTEEADKLLAPQMYQALFNEPAPKLNEKLRAAINEKNWQWHMRYRTMDGYNVYGGRSALAYQPGKAGFISDRNAPTPHVSNYKVMQEEMSQRDVLTANRDQRVWFVAKGGEMVVKDDNLPPVTPVKSNKPFSPEQEVAPFLSGEAAIAKMTLHSGMKVNLFADEKQFPDLVNPVQMMWDTKGRLWVAAWRNYPERTPTAKVGDKILVFEDTNGDGKADKVSTFIDDLNCPTGFQFYKDGLLLMQAPDLWFVRDTDGDGKADWKERILMGMDSADSHHTANAICHEPGGAIYLSDGVFHRTQVETANGPLRNNDGAIYRFEPRSGKFETHVSYGFANPHGRVFDRWGNDIVTDATGNNNYFGPAFSGRLDSGKHATLKDFWPRPSRPCPATGILSSRHFPEEFQGNFLNINVIAFQGIFRVKVTEDGSGLKGETMENIISSTDPNFRPICVSIGPDGAIYFCDWANNIIGHMQHHLRDPNRDHEHGRIYRITYEGRPLLKPKKIDGASIPALLELLKEPEDGVRELAKIELGKRDSKQVVAATKKWTASLNPADEDYEHHMMEALWVHQWHNVVDIALLKKLLASPDPRARAQAGRVLCYWRDRVPDALALLKTLAEDESPRPRLEAVRAASFFNNAEAAEMALASLKQPTDYYLDYTLKETLRQLEKQWRKAIAEGRPIASDNPAGLNRLIGSLSTAELQKLPARTPGVLVAMLTRPDLQDAQRVQTLDTLAADRKTTRLIELLNVIEGVRKTDAGTLGMLARMLPLQTSADIKAARERVASLTEAANPTDLREAAWAALSFGDGSFDRAWSEASQSPATLTDLLGGIPMLLDSDFRGQAYDRVKPLLTEVPPGLKASTPNKSAGRFVRIELPRRGTLTLAEVQVFSDGKNIAPQGKTKQSSTSNDGEAARAIDGKTDGAFTSGGQTHTREGDRNPWWELDLGAEKPVESIVIWNRTDAGLGSRLDGFSLTVFDSQRNEVFRKTGNPAPTPSARLNVGDADPAAALRRAAIHAAVAMPRDQETTFAALTGLISQRESVSDAAQGLRILPRTSWPKAGAAKAATALLDWARTIPAGDRTSQEFIEAANVASDLAGALPADEATALRKELRGLSVPVFVVKTVREQMRYDTPRIVVEAGKPFEIILVNNDFMSHNLVVVKPGTREKVGKAADAMQPDQLDDRGRAFLPKTTDIIYSTRLLDAGQRTTLSVGGIQDEGAYDYVCTYPNHWAVMWGQLIVTKDVDDYLAKNPEAKLPTPAAHQHE